MQNTIMPNVANSTLFDDLTQVAASCYHFCIFSHNNSKSQGTFADSELAMKPREGFARFNAFTEQEVFNCIFQ